MLVLATQVKLIPPKQKQQTAAFGCGDHQSGGKDDWEND
jgi:hypothetical protein